VSLSSFPLIGRTPGRIKQRQQVNADAEQRDILKALLAEIGELGGDLAANLIVDRR
jgi:hypothetical protein